MALPSAEELFDRHHLTVFRYLRRVTGDKELAEDLTQETFVRVIRGLETYDPRDRDLAWLLRIAKRLLMDHQRGARRRPSSLHPVPDVYGQADKTSRLESMDLNEALAGLNELDRETFLLREAGGLCYEEISSLLGITRDAVRNRIHRARKALREALTRGIEAVPDKKKASP